MTLALFHAFAILTLMKINFLVLLSTTVVKKASHLINTCSKIELDVNVKFKYHDFFPPIRV